MKMGKFEREYLGMLNESSMQDNIGGITKRLVFQPFVSRNGVEYIQGKLYEDQGVPQFGQYFMCGDDSSEHLVVYNFLYATEHSRENFSQYYDVVPVKRARFKRVRTFHQLMLPGIQERHQRFLQTGMLPEFTMDEYLFDENLEPACSTMIRTPDFYRWCEGVNVRIGHADQDIIWIAVYVDHDVFSKLGVKGTQEGFRKLLTDCRASGCCGTL